MSHLRAVFKWFMPLWKAHRSWMLLVFFLTTIAVAVSTMYPLMFKFIIDRIVHDGDPIGSRKWVLALLGAGAIQQVVQWLLPVSRARQNLELAHDIRLNTFVRVLKKTAPFFSRFRSGDLVTRLTDDVDNEDKLSWYGCSGVFRPIEAILRLFLAIGVMWALDWRLTLMAVAPLPIVVWLMTKTEHLQEKYYSERQKRTSETVEVLEAAFSGIRIVLSYAAEAAQSRLFHKALEKRVRSEKSVLTLRAVLEGLGSLLNQSGVIVVLFAGGWFLMLGEITLGDFYAFVAYLSSLTGPLWTLSWFFVSTTVVRASVDRLVQVQDCEERISGELEPNSTGGLRFQNVHFSHRSEALTPLLNGLSFDIPEGKIVAIVGSVGCGKSTVLELAAGILKPGEGRVDFGGASLLQLREDRRGHDLGWVPQESLLFSGEVAENVSLGREGIDECAVKKALKTACVDEEFGLDRRIEQGGVGLSGGQRGRVSLARALVTSPRLLLLDDATSALDLKTERQFWKALRQNHSNLAVLVATHREATAQVADHVLWLEEGQILHEGTHQELLRGQAAYRELFAC